MDKRLKDAFFFISEMTSQNNILQHENVLKKKSRLIESRKKAVALLKNETSMNIAYYKPFFSFSKDQNCLRLIVLFSISDARYIVPYEHSISTALKMVTEGNSLGKLRKNLLRILEVLKLKSILPQIVIMQHNNISSVIDHICEVSEIVNPQLCLFTGTPGLYRRMTLQLSDGKKTFQYAKLGTSTISKEKVRKELLTLKFLASLGIKTFQYPSIVHESSDGWFLQTSCDSSFQNSKDFNASHFAFIKELDDLSNKVCNVNEHNTFKIVINNKDLLSNDSSIIDTLEKIGKYRFSLSHSHGDFTPWNLRTNGNMLFVFDWESFQEDQLPLFDFIHYIFQEGILIKRQTAKGIYRHLTTVFQQYKFSKITLNELNVLIFIYVSYMYIEYQKSILKVNPGFIQVEWQQSVRKDIIELLKQLI